MPSRTPPQPNALPELSVAVHDHLGQRLATVDFRCRAQRVVGGSDGDVPRADRRDRLRAKERRAALEDAGRPVST